MRDAEQPPPDRPAAGPLGSLWHRLTWRHWREDRWSTALLLALLSLGVAAFLSIRMANREAVAGFASFNETVQPRSDWILSSPAGRLREGDLEALRSRLGLLPVELFPVLETAATRPTAATVDDALATPPAVRVVGVDLVALGGRGEGLLARLPEGQTPTPGLLFETGPPPVWLSPPLAARWESPPGRDLALVFNTTAQPVRVAGVLPAQSEVGETPPDLVVMDVADLQRLAGMEGRIDRLEAILPEADGWDAAIAELEEALVADPRWRLTRPQEQDGEDAEMTAAFRFNLTILSLIALLVALYLIVQALDAVVVRRRQEIAILRSLGMTPRMLRRFWLVEFLSLGIAGSIGGLLLGWLLAQGTAGAVAETVRRLYHPTTAGGFLIPTWGDAFLALVLGVGGSLVGGWLPLRDAVATPPAQVLAAGNFSPGFGIFRRPRLGLGLLVLGGVAVTLPPYTLENGSRLPLGGYAAAFAWLVGGTLVVGSLFRPLARILRPAEGRFPSLRLARSRLGDTSSRHRLAAAGLFVALAMAGGMSVLVSSFARTMDEWIDVRFQADLFLSSLGAGEMGREYLLESEVWQTIASAPEVTAADPFRVLEIELEGRSTFLGASRQGLLGSRQKVLWLEGPRPAEAVPGDTLPVIVNEAFAARFNMSVGDRFELPTPEGPRAVGVRGLVADYGNERGLVWMDWEPFVAWFDTDAATNLSLFLAPGADRVAFADALRAAHPAIVVRDNITLRSLVRRIFRQTFAITEALNLIGIAVAVGGLALALSNLLRESRRELETLRSLGMRRAEIARSTAWESLGIALAGTAGGLVMSLALGALLVFVINRQSFGWTLQWNVPISEFSRLAFLTLTLALLVGAVAGWRHGRMAAR